MTSLNNYDNPQIKSISQGEMMNREILGKSLAINCDIKKGKKYITIFRKGENDREPGEYVRTYVKDGESYIRTDDNKVNCDNLGTLPDIE